MLMHKGTLLQDMPFNAPYVTIFFKNSPNKLIVACGDSIFIVDVSTQSTEPFNITPKGAQCLPHAISLDDKDNVLVVGDCGNTTSVCGYDTASRTRMWIYDAVSAVCAVYTHGTQVLVSVERNPTLVLDLNTGAHIATLQTAYGRMLEWA
jgi:hypothetical protein